MLNRKDTDNTNNLLEEIHNYNICVPTREIFIHGHIQDAEEDPGVEYKMAMRVIKNIQFLTNISSDDITIHQYNIGGEWEAGMAIFDTIKLCKCHVTFICHGISASMGTVIMQAADKRLAMPNCMFLVHEGMTDMHPDLTIKQSKSLYEWETLCGKLMMNIYAERAYVGECFKGFAASKIKAYIQRKFDRQEDWILTSQQAVDYGLIDEIVT